MLVRATVDVTVRQTREFDIECTDISWPSRIGQMIQEEIDNGSDTIIAFHSVSWEAVE